MRIKRLEISGFKSFADRSVLHFGDGITGVVGPNGCGKSNIIDAIRWCMGEMSAKHLRGRAMQDVIFAGSDSKGPLGLAEVTLTFSNDGNVPPEYASFTEIAISRRLHRDGTSEYLINKIPMRLRDITDLFLGTGVGTRAYSIIEQGRIGFIVNSRPEDRRTLIEEVAGITKFKARKKAAERRMKATELNLSRVNDIIAELERQLNSLKRQAQKAERYKRLRGELRDLDLHKASVDVVDLVARQKHERQAIDVLQLQMGDLSTSIATVETDLEAEKLRLVEFEQEIQHKQEGAAAADTKVVTLRRDLDHWDQKLVETTHRIEDARSDEQDTLGRVRESGDESERLAEELSGLEGGSEASEYRLEELSATVESLQGTLSGIDAEVESLRRDALEHVHGAAQQRTLTMNLQKQRIESQRQLEVSKAEQETLRERLVEVDARKSTIEKSEQQLFGQLEAWTQELITLRERFEVLSAEVDQGSKRINELREVLTQRRSRLESLEDIARSLEGYSDGVRTLLRNGDDSSPAEVEGIVSLVTGILDVPEELEIAMEAVLGERLQYVVVRERVDAVRAIQYLKDKDGGRGGFIPQGLYGVGGVDAVSGEGVLGRAVDLISVDPAHQRVAEYLLSDVVVVKTLAIALELCELQSGHNGPRARFVTIDGEVVDAAGVIVGGVAEGAGLLSKKREIRELGELVGELQADLERSMERQQLLEHERLQLEIDIKQLDKETRASELERVELVKDLESTTAEQTRLNERAEVVSYEVSQRIKDLEAIDHEHEHALVAARAAEQGQVDVEERSRGLLERRLGLVEQLEDKVEQLTSLKIHLASRDEKMSALRGAIERLRLNRSEQQDRLEKDRKTIGEGQGLIEEVKDSLSAGERNLETLVLEAQQRQDELTGARVTYDSERTRLNEIEQVLRGRRREGGSMHESLSQHKMDLQRFELEQQQLIARIEERYDLSLMNVVGDYADRPPIDQEQRDRMVELERLIKGMGSINLTAIEEYSEVEQRHGFLVGQRDDLTDALDSLRRAINRINRTSRERFKEAFESVNEMFKKVFPRLFRGGVAHLDLCNSDDLLEAGVDITAQPPGKKLQNVGLLSGGEKALTAAALVFSIFLVKPTPFCVMDEVDAPLDDANVGRFCEMLREVSKISQFIVITHNKQTMSAADRLYGITMEEPGMSKVVSVDLDSVPKDQAA